MRCSLLTMYKSPTAMADNRTVNKSAAMSVKPRESRVIFPIYFPLLTSTAADSESLANGGTTAVGVAETHIASADGTRQIHALGLGSRLNDALSHDPHVDLL